MFRVSVVILTVMIMTGCVPVPAHKDGDGVVVHKSKGQTIKNVPPPSFEDTFEHTKIECTGYDLVIYYGSLQNIPPHLGTVREDIAITITEGACGEETGTPLVNGYGKAKALHQRQLLYSGNFRDGYMEGRGHLRDLFGGFEYRGDFSQGMFHGKGSMRIGERLYRGNFVWGKLDGIVTVTTPILQRTEHYSDGVFLQ